MRIGDGYEPGASERLLVERALEFTIFQLLVQLAEIVVPEDALIVRAIQMLQPESAEPRVLRGRKTEQIRLQLYQNLLEFLVQLSLLVDLVDAVQHLFPTLHLLLLTLTARRLHVIEFT